jgi:hypothetical protein
MGNYKRGKLTQSAKENVDCCEVLTAEAKQLLDDAKQTREDIHAILKTNIEDFVKNINDSNSIAKKVLDYSCPLIGECKKEGYASNMCIGNYQDCEKYKTSQK